MSKITVAKPDVERDGDRMTRYVGNIITQKLFPPLPETDPIDDARGRAARDATDGLVAFTVAAAFSTIPGSWKSAFAPCAPRDFPETGNCFPGTRSNAFQQTGVGVKSPAPAP